MSIPATMKAWVSHEPGGPETLVLEDRPVPKPARGEVLVRVLAVGVNFPDGLLIRDLYQVRPPRPLVPGSEFCGIVEAVGEQTARFRTGERVIGRSGWGAMAEFIALPEDRCIAVPDGLPAPEAAAFLFAYATAYHALRDVGRLCAGESLLVLGAAGGVGSAAVELGRALGATVIGAASSTAKVAFAQSLGATVGVRYDAALHPGPGQKALASELKARAPAGVDVVFDPVGGAYAEPALRSLARHGRHLVIGFAAGIPAVPLNLLLLGSRHLIGVDWRGFVLEEPAANARNVDALLDLWRQGAVAPRVTERHPFALAPGAIGRLASRDVTGKVVVLVD